MRRREKYKYTLLSVLATGLLGSCTFIERIILPTLAPTEHLVADAKILAGGPVVGRIVLRFILEARITAGR